MKTTGDAGGYGMLMGPFAAAKEIEAYLAQMKKNPGNYIAQPLVELSTHPTHMDGRFEPRRIDLRPFILYGDRIRVLPGGLTRVALRRGLLRRELLPGRRQQGHLGARAARAMILSRVADGLYWMGRYLERAENTTRLLLVTEELSTEMLGLDEQLARCEWNDLRAIFPGSRRTSRRPGTWPASPPPRCWRSPSIPRIRYSVFFSLKKARDNARAVREALTRRVLHQPQRDLPRARGLQPPPPRRIPPTFRTAIAVTHRGILSAVGAIEHTLTRDAGWLFLKLGESLERVYRTAP